ncbi:hypothetical protein SAMN04487890_12266 [Mucilaginibacter polytrichastri]|nr:hypothetical protein SAMN04487890_12266 [Mucilaginibacter polytrichastri]
MTVLWVIKANSGQTDDTFSLIELTMLSGLGRPPHLHQGVEEIFCIKR